MVPDSDYFELRDQTNPSRRELDTVVSAPNLYQKRFAVILPILALCLMTYYVMLLQSYMVKKIPETGTLNGYSTVSDYYDNIDFTSTDEKLKSQLQALIYNHVSITYDKVWEAFADIYKNYPCDGNPEHIPDVYSSFCWLPKKSSPHGECGSYKQEGDCFNREHIWPKAWFGGFEHGDGAQTDLFELAPSDGKVNAERGELPLGDVRDGEVAYTSSNGCRIGTCASELYAGKCFEVTDHLKGDFARTYFYLSVAYNGHWKCCDTDGVDGARIKPWMEKELRRWHVRDPVDSLERMRNEVVFARWQRNRNPFIDYPRLVDQIKDF